MANVVVGCLPVWPVRRDQVYPLLLPPQGAGQTDQGGGRQCAAEYSHLDKSSYEFVWLGWPADPSVQWWAPRWEQAGCGGGGSGGGGIGGGVPPAGGVATCWISFSLSWVVSFTHKSLVLISMSELSCTSSCVHCHSVSCTLYTLQLSSCTGHLCTSPSNRFYLELLGPHMILSCSGMNHFGSFVYYTLNSNQFSW